MLATLPIVDSHLDLAENVTLFGRDLTLDVADIRVLEKRAASQATVSLPELERGSIAVAIATVTAGFLAQDAGEDFEPSTALYRTSEEAEAQALTQIKLYESWDNQGRVRLIKSTADLEHHLQLWQDDSKPGLVMLMEGADPIVQVRDLPGKYSRVCASHANARTLTPTDRHLSDEVIRAVAERNGVIGLVLYNGFLEPRWKQDKTMAITLDEHLRRHAQYIANLTDWSHVGIGSDLDGGFGLEESPLEINTVADLYKVGAIVPAEVRETVLSSNWLKFLRRSLPQTSTSRGSSGYGPLS